jgi:hypothetical protein
VLSACIGIRPVAIGRDDLARNGPFPGGARGRRESKEGSESEQESAHAANVRACREPAERRVTELCEFVAATAELVAELCEFVTRR